MARGPRIAVALGLAVVLLGGLVFSWRTDGREESYASLPVLERLVQMDEGTPGHPPARLQVRGDTLFVSYNGLPRIDLFDLDVNPLGTIHLTAPEPILPTSFAVTDSQVLVADHGRGVIARFARDGSYLESHDTLPDGTTRLSPIAVTSYDGMAYVADMKIRRVLAIALNTQPGVTETGELILTVPPLGIEPTGFPSAVQVTPDGRLLIGDAQAGKVSAHTCDGRFVYDFDAIPGLRNMAPQGFAADDRTDPSLQDENSFDPSGIRAQGRWHVVDGYNGQVHMFNPLGRYLGSYPDEARLAGPAGIAIDRANRRIYVADPPTGRILIYRYEE